MWKGVFITGTDTGVGKTVIAAGLAAYLKSGGVKVAVMKPVQTGAKPVNGRVESEDLKLLLKAVAIDEPHELTNPYCLELASAPDLAAKLAGIQIEPQQIIRAYQKLTTGYRTVIVEGAGGLLVPIRDGYTFVDLVKELKLPILIVARATLGTINHTALTVKCAQSEGIPVAGIILNHASPGADGLVEKHNPAIIQQLTGVPVWGTVPYSPSISVEQAQLGNIASLMEERLELGWLREQLI
jgi:dethiobiotin synthetase